MNKLLKDLYDCFYTPPELAATKREIEECHRALIEALGKPERRLVLKIIDAKDHISEDTSLDSFISGFRLAWRLSAELNHYDDERPARCQAAEKPGARFTLLAPGAHSQFGSGKNTQFEPEQRANPFENVFSKTAVFPPPAIAETDL